MKISDMISMCFGNLFRRKMRTILTVIGVGVDRSPEWRS